MISYAQNFEDVILSRALRDVGDYGFYVDIGAQDPVIDSVSMAFCDRGWRGVHVEPSALFAQKLRDARPDEEVLETAIGRGEGRIDFFEIGETGLSTGIKRNARRAKKAGHSVRQLTVPVLPLSSVLDRYGDRDVHWLKIDAEGMEQQIIETWAPSTVRPWIVVVESLEPVFETLNPAQLNSEHASWEPTLIGLGYSFVYFDGLNRFYLSEQKVDLRDRFSSGPSVFDDFDLPEWSSHVRSIRAELAGLRSSRPEPIRELVAARQQAQNLAKIIDRQSAVIGRFGVELLAIRSSLNAVEHSLSTERDDRTRADRAAAEALAADRRMRLSEAKARQVMTDKLQSLTVELRNQNARIEADRRALESARAAAQESANQAHKNIAASQRAVEKARKERDALANSTSWRVTAPFRSFSSGARSLVKFLARSGRRSTEALLLRPNTGTRRAAKQVLGAAASTVRRVPVARTLAKAAVTAIPPLHRIVRSTSPMAKKERKGRKQIHAHVAPTIVANLASPSRRPPDRLSRRSRGFYWVTRAAQSRNLD